MITVNIPDAISQARVDCDVSQRKIAAMLNVSYQTVQRWENGITEIPYKKLCDWFNVLHLKPYKYLYPNINEAIIEAVNDLSEESQAQLLQLLSKSNSEEIINYALLGSEVFSNEK